MGRKERERIAIRGLIGGGGREREPYIMCKHAAMDTKPEIMMMINKQFPVDEMQQKD